MSIFVSQQVIPGIRHRLSPEMLRLYGVRAEWSEPQVVATNVEAVLLARRCFGIAIVSELDEGITDVKVGGYFLYGCHCHFLDFGLKPGPPSL